MRDLQRWSQVAEIVGAVAVVISIVYLTIEVQRNTSAIQSQTSQGLLEMANETNQLLSMISISLDQAEQQMLPMAVYSR